VRKKKVRRHWGGTNQKLGKRIYKAPLANSRYRIRHIVARQYAPGGMWAEFGVREGRSAAHLLEMLPEDGELHLYDSWEGLPEDWIRSPKELIRAGHFACKVPVFDDERVTMHPGWFSETLKTPQPAFDLVHLDCDLYQSTKDVLDKIVLNDGAVLLFDDMTGYEFCQDHQMKAWFEFLEETGLDFEYIARTPKGQLAARIKL